MHVWLIHIGELLSIDGPVRPYRYEILAQMLSKMGHHVTRWAPTFIHTYKRHRFLHDQKIQLNDYYTIELLYVKGYKKNISLNRIRFNRQLAKKFAKRIKRIKPPDIIVSAIPSNEMCYESINYAKQHSIPCVIDIRDLWPDIFLDAVPKRIQWLGKLFLRPLFKTNNYILHEANGIIGVSHTYLNWGLANANRKKQETDEVFPIGYVEKKIDERRYASEKENLLKMGIDPQKCICCFFGQFEATYDLETVIDAAKEFQDTGQTQVQFVLCGSGKKIKALQKRATGLKNVIFLGWVSYATLSVLKTVSSIGLVSYVKNAPQSLPNKPFEYFSGGLAVISSLRGELEIILEEEDCGITYDAENVKDLVNAIKALIADPERIKKMGHNAKLLYEKRFCAESIYPAMIEHLEKIATKSLIKPR